jgi:adenosylcobinamide kinase/adenosylcobinamide-phosphate guanylyltransferase
VAGYDVRVCPRRTPRPDVGPAVLYDLTGPDGARLLWATDTGVLSEQALALVQGPGVRRGAARPDQRAPAGPPRPDHLAGAGRGLRARGAVVAGTAVHAIHLGHDNPPDVDAVLAGWGASAPRDGDVLEVGR